MTPPEGTTPDRLFRTGSVLLLATAVMQVIDWWRRLDFLREKLAGTAVPDWLFGEGARLALLLVGLVFVFLGWWARRQPSSLDSRPNWAIDPRPRTIDEPPTAPIETAIDKLIELADGKTDLAAFEALRKEYAGGVLVTGHLAGVSGTHLRGQLVNPAGDAQIYVSFASRWRPALAQLPPGQLVTVKGEISAVLHHILDLRQCDLVRTVPGSEVGFKGFDHLAAVRRSTKSPT